MYTARGANWAVRGRPVSRRPGVPITDGPDGPGLTTPIKGEPKMGKIIVSENVTLDGVVQDDRGWFGGFRGKDYEEWAKVETD
jgi:hypothetical protein